MASPFEELGLQSQFVEAVDKLGYDNPTSIQSATIPLLLSGRDVIAQSQTGTGKTAAFMLPVLQQLEPNNRSVQVLVLAPTRELAKQVAEATQGFAENTRAKILAVYGGQSYEIQIRALKRGVDIVVGTPGRLLDLIRKGILDLSEVKTLILDEADEMLEMGFIDDVEFILGELPAERQIALFSATLPDQIRKLASKYLVNPGKISISPNQLTVAETEQRYYRIREESKMPALTRLLETDDVSSGLIFVRTKARAQDIADELLRRGFSADSLHGDLNQSRREMVLNRFRQGTVTLLVATDVAARGLDILDVSHVFNYDVPADAEDYVHRIGRTGRAGKKGIAITLLTPRERGRMNQIQGYTHQPVKEFELPSIEEVQDKRDIKLMERISSELTSGNDQNELGLLAKLRAAGLSDEKIAIAALKMVRATEGKTTITEMSKPEKSERSTSNSMRFTDQPRSGKGSKRGRSESRVTTGNGNVREAGMVRLWMNLGDRNGLRPGDIVGAIAGESGIPGKSIGEIDIHSNYSLVDVAEAHVRNVLKASSGGYRVKGKPVLLKLAD